MRARFLLALGVVSIAGSFAACGSDDQASGSGSSGEGGSSGSGVGTGGTDASATGGSGGSTGGYGGSTGGTGGSTGGEAGATGGGAGAGGDALPTDAGIIDGPIGEWVFYEIPGAVCANGTPTGIGVNQGSGSRVVIYLSGGGTCTNEDCTVGTPSMRRDGGFGAAQLQACVAGNCDGSVTFPAESIFNRSASMNPFVDATYVFISNCSGDYYVGNNEHAFPGWTARFQGSRNQRLFAAEIAASFPNASRVILSGGSAGSVGAMLNHWQWVNAFPNTRVDLVSDSFALAFFDGPEWRYELHNPTVPPGCTTCATDYRTIYDFNASIAPSSRIAVLDSENNWTLDLVTGYQYTQGLEALQQNLDQIPNLKYYVANGNVHILLQYALDNAAIDVQTSSSGTHQLSEFLRKMQDDDPAWQSLTCLGG